MSRTRKSKSRPLRIVLLADDGSIHASDPRCERAHGGVTDDFYQVAGALRCLGHEVVPMTFDVDVPKFVGRLRAAKPDLIFNSTEAIGDDRCAYGNIAALLDLLCIPYTGSGPTALALTMDKATTKHILQRHGVPVSESFVIRQGKFGLPADIRFPFFVKPLHGGAKEGITRASLVRDRQALKRQIKHIHKTYDQPAICEEFIDGRELTLGIMGNKKLKAFPVRELVFNHTEPGSPSFFTRKVLEDKAYRDFWGLTMRDAPLSPAQRHTVVGLAQTAFRAVGLRDYGRMDIRLGLDGRFYFLEVNANPALRRPSASLIAPWGGIPYEKLIQRVLHLALERHGRSNLLRRL
jgi:D-alanine-D-alanine ligase